ncbi:MAG: DUF3108 domain-containing protein [Betaproteobacteria bacterium]|nr:DUF3108 domain-containing protein [Betaproteobacteria bacterium]
MQRRFQRQGVLGALVLHLAFPVALTASQWWPLIANQQVADGGREHDRDHEAANEDSKQDEMASLKTLSKGQRSQLRMIVAQQVAHVEPSKDRNALAASKPSLDQQAEPLPDQQVALQPDDAEQAAANPDQQASLQEQAGSPPQMQPTLAEALSAEAQAGVPRNEQAGDTRDERAGDMRDERAGDTRDERAGVPGAPQAEDKKADQTALSKPVNPPSDSPATDRPGKARKAELEAELRALSERIEAYQRQQEKEQAEQAATMRAPHEAQAPAAQAAPAAESASREAMIQARLPVQLKALRGQWNYKMYYGDRADDSVVALVRFEVEVTDSLYVLRSLARPQGFAAVLFQGDFTQESRGTVSEWGYQPSYYEEHRGQRGKRWAQMDWEQREVRLSDGARLPIAQGVQDRLSIAWQLSALARSQLKRLQSSTGIQIPLILTKNIELNRFFARAIAEDTIDGQRLRLLKVEREPRPGKRDASIEVWLDIDRDMLPVRLRVEDRRGRVVEQVLQKESW